MPSPIPSDLSSQTRRDFLQHAGAVASAGWLAVVWPSVLSTATYARQARMNGAPLSVLTKAEAATLDAVAAQIIPSGDGLPGAREAGVVHFMDRALETFMAPALESVRSGLTEFENGIRTVNPGVESFADLSVDVQTDMMALMVEMPLFGTICFLTLAGMFAHPSYGGNRNRAGWQMIGFDDRHVWQPPFGYYDEQEGRD